MLRYIIPTALTFIALSQNPVYAQGEGRRAIKAKDLQKEDMSVSELSKKLHTHGRKMLLIEKLKRPEALSYVNIKNAVRAFQDDGLFHFRSDGRGLEINEVIYQDYIQRLMRLLDASS